MKTDQPTKPQIKTVNVRIPLPLWQELRNLVTQGRQTTLAGALIAGAWKLVDGEKEPGA